MAEEKLQSLRSKTRQLNSKHQRFSKTLPPTCKCGPKTQSHKMKGGIIGLLKTTTFPLVSTGTERIKENKTKVT